MSALHPTLKRTDCLRCPRTIRTDDLALRCTRCTARYHHDCFIPGAACEVKACGGKIEFQKSIARCTRAQCERLPARMGWTWLGPGARSLCHEHAAGFRFSEGLSLLGTLLALGLYFLLKAGGRLDAVLHNAYAVEILTGVLVSFLGVTGAFWADSYRIWQADPEG